MGKICITCKKTLQLQDFYFNKTLNKYFYECKKCLNKRSKKRFYIQYKIKFSNTWFNRRYNTLKQRARLKNIIFDLSLKDFKKLKRKKNCTYCKLTNTITTIDRINNNLGYLKYNCTACCIRCNRKKSDLTPEVIKRIYYSLRKSTRNKKLEPTIK